MKKILKKIAPRFIIDYILLLEWEMKGRPAPPPHCLKQSVITKYKKIFSSNILVETGTYMGDMVYAMRNKFKYIYSIELDNSLWSRANKIFHENPNINIMFGDSGKVLYEIIPEIKERAIFWLDGHYSGGVTARGKIDSPISEELAAILGSNIDHIILIDDARCFNGSSNYPTLEDLSYLILSKKNTTTLK